MEQLYDVIVIGSGPAGLTAALYLARARYRVLVLERGRLGGQIAITEEVVNYPGIPSTSGAALAQAMEQQARVFGASFLEAEAVELQMDGDIKTVSTTAGAFRSFGVLLATGAQPRMVGFQGEDEHRGRGVAYCATCDGEFFTGKEVFVVGGGYAAAEESVFLTKFARHVTILMRKGDFSCATGVAERAKNHEKITIEPNTVVEEVAGDRGLDYIRYKNTATGEVTEYRADPGDYFGVFVLAGYAPSTELVRGLAELDHQGYVVTDGNQKTSVEGLYAAGDVCIKPLRQVVTATADGALAATALEKYVAKLQEKTGLRPEIPPVEHREKAEPVVAGEGELFSSQMQQQLKTLFEKMGESMVLELHLDDGELARELQQFTEQLRSMTEKLRLTVVQEESGPEVPWVSVYRGDGSPTGLAFHGVPGGHEFTSFVLGIYYGSGAGQPLEPELLERIRAIEKPVDMKILVTLGCNMCPELVTGAQRIALEQENITAHVYDIGRFPELRQRYNVMSVPCLVLPGDRVSFGKKSIPQLVDLLTE